MENLENTTRNFSEKNGGKNQSGRKVIKKNTAGRDLFFAVLSFVILLGAGITVYFLYNGWNKKHLQLMEARENSYTEQLTARDSMINEWIITFDQIEKDLHSIREKEQMITLRSADVEFSTEKKQQILDDIKYINTLLDENKKKIASLNSQLQKSGGTIKGLQIKIAELEESVRQRENEISVLKTQLVDRDFEIGQLNSRMSDLQLIVAQQGEEIIYHTDVRNTGYLAYGTFKELKEKGLVSKDGGFLGLGKRRTLAEHFDDDSFTRVRITDTKTIPVQSKNVRFITPHPTDSYEFYQDEVNKQIAFIGIKDPEQFWKVSKYAVVEIIK